MEIKFEHGIKEEQANLAALLINLKNVAKDLDTVWCCLELLMPAGFTYGQGASHIWIHSHEQYKRWAIITE